jgi:trehalose 6-phosphate synthase/phosphatase
MLRGLQSSKTLMPQVIIVSNRLPVSVKKTEGQLSFYASVGGLSTGLASYVADSKNNWIGWPGIASDELTNDDRQTIVTELAKHNCSPVFLSKREIDAFYSGYSNTVLWPLFHNLAKQKNVTPEQRERWWSTYRSVNRQYAQATLTVAETASRIWIHDYQLLLVPSFLRAERSDIITGFFLHIPFPDTKTLARLPEHQRLLNGLLGADVIGFHTPGYVTNFLEDCQAAGLTLDKSNMLVLPDHTIRVGDFPMGIDYQKFAQANKSKEVKAAVRKYRKRYKRLRVIVAVDRMDPSKGLVERLEAYRTFLAVQPRLRGKIVFSMVAAPSRTDVVAYQQLAKRLDVLVQEINATYGTAKWQPVDYMNVSVPFEEVTALFQIADVAFIAPLRDGMNLAAKEFIASKHKSGVLILSQTAGAAHELPDAILVNPKKPDELVDALQQALTMRRRELRARLKRMQQTLATNTVQDWAQDFVEALQKPIPGTPTITRALKGKFATALTHDYRQAATRLLLLDYDGSLVPFAVDYHDAQPPKSLLTLLETLSQDAGNDVVLISGRSADDLESWFGNLSISLVAEHGAALKKADATSWQTIEKVDTAWKKLLLPVLEKYASKTPKARVEVKPHSLVWHYRGSPPYYAEKYAVILKRVLKPILKTYGLELLQGNKILEIKNPRVNKGSAAQRWLRGKYDFILALGDDATDEELFLALPSSATATAAANSIASLSAVVNNITNPQAATDAIYSIKVGRGLTAARFRLPSDRDVVALLKKLSK